MSTDPDEAGNEAGPSLCIERGSPTDEEVAVVTVALLVALRRAQEAEPTPSVPVPALWLRLERNAAFRPGHSWQRTTRTPEPSCARC
ncbi:MAG TPA: acyl-CoA carboxylase epsilon subunit [Actinospica sp.]|jgi:hypothetical protein|nr:acyl-CoA carboxylase epsilon subunit [Actinospica sp.]